MSDKYIITNCPAYQKELIIMDFKTGETKTTDKNYCINPFCSNTCQDCTDCLLKQIVQKCKGVQEKFYDAVHSRYLSPSKAKFTREILDLLQIEEVE